VTAGGAAFIALNRGKRSVRLNLKSDAGREAFLSAVAKADVVVESFRPGVLERLGLAYEQLAEINPRVVLCSITGFGQDGPLAHRSGHDLNFIGRAGLLDLTGTSPDAPPVIPGVMVADMAGGALTAVVGILLALHERQRSGKGQHVDISMTDGTLALMGLAATVAANCDVDVGRGESLFAGATVCYSAYRCRDGWITLAAVERKFWRNLCTGLGLPELEDQQFAPAGSNVHHRLSEVFGAKSRGEWKGFADAHDCCLDIVLTTREAMDDELMRKRGMVVDIGAGPGTRATVVASPIRLSRTPAELGASAPVLGADTNEFLIQLGYRAQEIAEMVEARSAALEATGPQGTFL
jgi:crotonobetainyl-CoA:carnitine CoA-transferase CaiB-like acyl-CoA transferase